MNIIRKLSEISSDIAIIKGIDPKYKFLIKNRVDLFAIVQSNIYNTEFVDKSLDTKLVSKFISTIGRNKHFITTREDNYIYEINGDFYLFDIYSALENNTTAYDLIYGNYNPLPLLKEYYDEQRKILLDSFTDYDNFLFTMEPKYRDRLSFKINERISDLIKCEARHTYRGDKCKCCYYSCFKAKEYYSFHKNNMCDCCKNKGNYVNYDIYMKVKFKFYPEIFNKKVFEIISKKLNHITLNITGKYLIKLN